MKLLHGLLLLLGVVSPCACTAVSSPTAPGALSPADTTNAASGFEPLFYSAFVQNAHEKPDRLEPIRLLRGPLRIYLRTSDDAGRAIDAVTLDTTERALVQSAWIWSGHTFGVAEIARGAGTREHATGWITVKWASRSSAAQCGRSTVGVDGGFIELNASGACSCGAASLVYPRLVRHEMGHAMGYYHTADVEDVMYGRAIPSTACDVLPSDRERRHARFAHAAASSNR